MLETIRDLIIDQLQDCNDADLLDLIYKLLLDNC